MAKKVRNPGDYNRRVTIQKRTLLERPGGDNETVWYEDDAFSVWASITPLRGREYVAAGALSSPEIILAKTWYRPGVMPLDHRLLYGGKVFNIEGVSDLGGAHVEIELVCTEEPGAIGAIPRP